MTAVAIPLLPCPWCGEPLHLMTDASYGYFDHSWIECRNRACDVQPRGKKMDNTTWTQGEGTRSHHKATATKLVEAWSKRR